MSTRTRQCLPEQDSVYRNKTVSTGMRQCLPGQDSVYQDKTVSTGTRQCLPEQDSVYQDETVSTWMRQTGSAYLYEKESLQQDAEEDVGYHLAECWQRLGPATTAAVGCISDILSGSTQATWVRQQNSLLIT